MLAFAAFIALGAGWYAMRGGSREVPTVRTEPTVSEPEMVVLDEPLAPTREPLAQRSGSETAPVEAPHPAGSITVRARFADGMLPKEWTLDLEDVGLVPHDPKAARTSVNVSGAEITVERRLDTVHRLRGRSAGLSSAAHEVSLSRDRNAVDVEILLEPAAVVEGLVVGADDKPVAERGVWLQRIQFESSAREPSMDHYTRTSSSGEFRFDAVPAGMWRIQVGERTSPLVGLVGVRVELPLTRVDTIRLPPLHALALRIVDEHDLPVRDARLWSRGSNGGAFDVAGDAYGEARVADLPAGRWRVFAQSATSGRANLSIELPRPNVNEAVVLKLHSRP